MSKVVKAVLGVVLIAAGVFLPLPPPLKTFLISAGVSMTLSGVAEFLAPTPKFRPPPIAGNTAGGLDTIPLVFGTIRMGGKHVVPATVSDNYKKHSADPGTDGVSESYWVAIAHCLCSANGVQSLGDVYLDGRLITAGNIDGNGWVTHADWLDDEGHPMVQIKSFLGSHSQAASADLDANVTDWTTDHRLRGIAYTVARFVRPTGEKSEARFQEVFGGRVPEISRVVSGCMCYDVRQDTTRGGSGTQRADDPTTWTWSDNPALIAATYLLMREKDFGVGIDPDLIDWTTVAGAANECDLTFSTPSGSLARYRFNGVLDSPNPDENLSHIADAMAGVVTYDGIRGKWIMFAGAYDAPSHTIDEAWLRGDIVYNSKSEIGQLWNASKVNYVQPSLDYEPATCLLRTNSTYETEDDGQQLVRELHIPGIDHEFRAQRRAIIEVNRSREQRILQLKCNMKALAVDFWDVVTISLPDTTLNGTYRVIEYKWAEDGFPDLTLLEAIATTYNTVSGDYTSRTFPAAPGRTNEVPPTPENLTLTATVEGVLVEVDPLGRHAYDTFEFQRSTVSNFSSIEKTRITPDPQFIDRVTTSTLRYYRCRAKKGAKYSGWSTSASVTPNPGETGASVATKGLGMKLNAAANGGANAGEICLHGFTNGVADFTKDGFIMWNGSKITVPRDAGDGFTILGSGAGQPKKFMIFDTQKPGTPRFTASGQARHTVLAYKDSTGQWYYDTNTSVSAFTPIQDRDVALGWVEMSGDNCLDGGLFGEPMGLEWIASAIMNQSWLAVEEFLSFDNLIKNPGFESGKLYPAADNPSGGTWSVVTTAPRSGNYHLKYDPAGQTAAATVSLNGSSGLGPLRHFNCQEGDQFYFEAWARRSGGSNFTLAPVRLLFYDETQTQLANIIGPDHTITTSYQRCSVTAIAPAGAVYVIPSLRATTAAGSALTFYDDCYMRRVVGVDIAQGLFSGGLVSAFNVTPITGWTDAGSTATINLQASTLRIGNRVISYPSGSVSGLAFNTKYHIYRDDPQLDGGGSYAATTSVQTAVNDPNRIFFGTFTTGSDGGSGGGGGSPGSCVAVDQWISQTKRAADVTAGDLVTCLCPDGYELAAVEAAGHSPQPCVELVTVSGIRLVCSRSTPLTLRDGSTIEVGEGRNAEVAVLDRGEFRWEQIVSVNDIVGPREVAHIHVGGRTYAAGAVPDRFIFTHNPSKP
jgi:hypothetical protein